MEKANNKYYSKEYKIEILSKSMHLLIKIGCLYRFDMLTEALNYMLTVKGFLPVIATVGSLAIGLEILVCS